MIYRQVLRNDLTITHTFYGSDEETATDATGSVTVTVAREDGTALTGGTIATNNGTTGQYDFNLTAASHTDELDVLTITWTATVDGAATEAKSFASIVGGRYFSIPQLRAMRGVADTSEFTSATLKSARDVVEDWVEDFTRQHFVPSYAREIFDGDDSECILLNSLDARRLIEVKITDTVADTTSWSLTKDGRIHTDGERFVRLIPQGNNIQVKYEHGYDRTPLDLQRACLTLARHVLLEADSTIPDRARMMQTEWAQFHLDTASEDKPSGIPEVDAVLCRYRRNAPDWTFG